jgi:hypothetical protein
MCGEEEERTCDSYIEIAIFLPVTKCQPAGLDASGVRRNSAVVAVVRVHRAMVAGGDLGAARYASADGVAVLI